MSNESVVESGERYARDLRRIREYRDVSIDDIHESTRIARTLIETFERGDLYDHPGFNRVYLRSFIRAYAGCIDVDPKRALAGLDAVKSGDYTNELAAAYLTDADPDELAGSSSASDSATAAESETSDAEGEGVSADHPASPDDAGDGAAGDDSAYSRRLNRPMGGTAAASDDLSSVSKPKPMTSPSDSPDEDAAGDDPSSTDTGSTDTGASEQEDAAQPDSTGATDPSTEPSGDSGGAEDNLPAWMKTGGDDEQRSSRQISSSTTSGAPPSSTTEGAASRLRDNPTSREQGTSDASSTSTPTSRGDAGGETAETVGDGGDPAQADFDGNMISEARPVESDDDSGDDASDDWQDEDSPDQSRAEAATGAEEDTLTAEEAAARAQRDEAEQDDTESSAGTDKPSWFGAHDEDDLTEVTAEPSGDVQEAEESDVAESGIHDEDDEGGAETDTAVETPDEAPHDAGDETMDQPAGEDVGDAAPGDGEIVGEAAAVGEAEPVQSDDADSVEESTGDETQPPPEKSDEDGTHPLMRDPEEMDVEEDRDEPRPPDLQPHEDPNSEIGPAVDDGEEAPAWLSGESDETASTAPSFDPGSASQGGRGPVDDAPNPLVTLARQRTAGLAATAVGVLVVVGALIAWSMGVFSGEETSAPATSEPATADTAATTAATDTTSQQPSRPPLANLTIGDPIYVTVVAENDVSAIRIRRDDDLRRPYWIEAGQATVFPFSERIIIEDEWDNVDRILLEGYRYPLDERDAAGRLEITRAGASTFADTVRGAPADVNVTPDTSQIPPPSQRQPEPAAEDTASTPSGDSNVSRAPTPSVEPAAPDTSTSTGSVGGG